MLLVHKNLQQIIFFKLIQQFVLLQRGQSCGRGVFPWAALRVMGSELRRLKDGDQRGLSP